MKIKINSAYLLFAVAIIGYMSIARSSNPPNGRTGAPGDGLCLDCHSGGAGLDGEVTITGIPTSIMPSTTYRVTVTTTNPNGQASRAGFQMVALDNSNLNAGTLSNPGASSDTEDSGGRTYFEHRPAVFFPASNSVSWEADWESPAGPGGETITFYSAAIIGNGSGAGSDRTVTTTFAGVLDAGPPDPPVAMVTTTNSTCNGADDGTASVTVTGGTMPYQFSWSNGGSTQTITGLAPGDYSVTVTDALNESGMATGTVGEPAEIITNFNIVNPDCFGLSGSIDLEVSGGNNSFSYLWNTGATTQDLTDIPAGTYSLTLTDAPSCELTFMNIVVTEPDELDASIDVLDVDCNGNDNGQIAITPIGGTAPFTYDWSNGTSDAVNDDLSPGTYSVTITDANMCTIFREDLIVGEPDVLAANASSTNESTPGANDGTASANPVGGNPPYFYLWSNGLNTQDIDNLAAGPYTVTVTDNKNCINVETVVVQAGACDIIASVNTTPSSCVNSMDGNAIAILTGGTEPFKYLWNNGDTTQTSDNLSSGDYSVTVTDANDCIAVGSGSVGVMDTQSPIAVATFAVVYVDSNGVATVQPEDINDGSIDNCGSENLTLSLDQSTFGCDNLGLNTVILTVTDVSGNSDTASAVVSVIDTIAPSLSCQGTVLATECNTVTYNVPTIIDNCSTTDMPILVSGIPSGETFPIGETEIVYMYTDASDNEGMCSFIVRVNPNLSITVDSIKDVSTGNDGGIFVTLSGGSGSFSYEWMENDNIISNDEDLINVGPGLYELKVTDDSTACVLFSDTIRVDGTVNTIDPALDDALTIYPNPAKDFLQVQLEGIETHLNLEVLSLNGKVVLQEQLVGSSNQLDVKMLSSGLYFIKVFDGDRFTIRKILVE